jgi:hypothetical protein
MIDRFSIAVRVVLLRSIADVAGERQSVMESDTMCFAQLRMLVLR